MALGKTREVAEWIQVGYSWQSYPVEKFPSGNTKAVILQLLAVQERDFITKLLLFQDKLQLELLLSRSESIIPKT